MKEIPLLNSHLKAQEPIGTSLLSAFALPMIFRQGLHSLYHLSPLLSDCMV
jgi:hypothetical protein